MIEWLFGPAPIAGISFVGGFMQVASVGVPKYPEATVKRNPRLGLLLVLAAGVPFWATVVWLVLR